MRGLLTHISAARSTAMPFVPAQLEGLTTTTATFEQLQSGTRGLRLERYAQFGGRCLAGRFEGTEQEGRRTMALGDELQPSQITRTYPRSSSRRTRIRPSQREAASP
jgi:hypothetical protein